MLKRFLGYDLSYAEVILLALSDKVDIRLNNQYFNYLLDESYNLDYLIYPDSENMVGLVTMLKEITQNDDKLFAVNLPRLSTEIRPIDKEEQINDILSDLNKDIAIELVQSPNNILDNMKETPEADFPYLFENIEVLGDYLTSNDDDLFGMLISTVFFSTRFDWMLIFDYELEALHFMYKAEVGKILLNNEYFQKSKYSYAEICDMIEQIKNDAQN